MPEKANNSEDQVRQFQRELYRAAKRCPNRRFHALYDKLTRWDVLVESWYQVRANQGHGGVDGKSLEDIEKEGVGLFLQQIREELRAGTYRPQPVKRVEIPKPDGGKRPLGIPVIRDRVVQAACRKMVEPIFEADFLEGSYGFRPKRSAHQAHEEILKWIDRGCRFVVDGDIRKYFDSIDHAKLMVLMRQRIGDKKILELIQRWLEAGVLTEGRLMPTSEGTPQGGVISPLLSNIFLHLLDKVWNKRYKQLGKLVRYADDFVVLCPTQQKAEESLKVLKRLLGRLGLELHPEKTRLVEMGPGKDGFDFLGFHYRICRPNKKRGKAYIKSWPKRKSMKKITERVKAVTSEKWRLSLSMEELVKTLNPILRGWANYFKVGTSWKQFDKVDSYTYRRLLLFRRRKHGQRIMDWSGVGDEFKRLGLYRLSRRAIVD
jgi:group II intron reverse transcriptase/maturase